MSHSLGNFLVDMRMTNTDTWVYNRQRACDTKDWIINVLLISIMNVVIRNENCLTIPATTNFYKKKMLQLNF